MDPYHLSIAPGGHMIARSQIPENHYKSHHNLHETMDANVEIRQKQHLIRF